LVRLGAAALVACAVLAPAQAHARGIILITWGETISHTGTASAPANFLGGKDGPGPQGAEPAPGFPVKVGYRWHYFGIFWIDLWTWGGEYCIYEGKRYHPLRPAEAAQLLGKSESELTRPFLYRFPLGLLLLGPIIGLLILLGAMDARKQSRRKDAVAQLFQDARYQQAVAILHDHLGPPAAAVSPGQDAGQPPQPSAQGRFAAAFEAGVQHLVSQGIQREDAERNLAIMVQVLDAAARQADAQAAAPPAAAPPAQAEPHA
jgi:hypothetical protein